MFLYVFVLLSVFSCGILLAAYIRINIRSSSQSVAYYDTMAGMITVFVSVTGRKTDRISIALKEVAI